MATDDSLEPLVRALRALARRRGYSLRGLARCLGVSPGHLSMLFRGQRRPGLRLLRAACERVPELRPLLTEHVTPGEAQHAGRRRPPSPR